MKKINVFSEQKMVLRELKMSGFPKSGLSKLNKLATPKKYPKNRFFCACGDLWTLKTLAKAKKDFDKAVSDEVSQMVSGEGIGMCDWVYGEIIDVFDNEKDFVLYRKFVRTISKLGVKSKRVNHDMYLSKNNKFGCAILKGEEGVVFYSDYSEAIDSFDDYGAGSVFCVIKIFEEASVRDVVRRNGKVIARRPV